MLNLWEPHCWVYLLTIDVTSYNEERAERAAVCPFTMNQLIRGSFKRYLLDVELDLIMKAPA
jgi:hypothetical protein